MMRWNKALFYVAIAMVAGMISGSDKTEAFDPASLYKVKNFAFETKYRDELDKTVKISGSYERTLKEAVEKAGGSIFVIKEGMSPRRYFIMDEPQAVVVNDGEFHILFQARDILDDLWAATLRHRIIMNSEAAQRRALTGITKEGLYFDGTKAGQPAKTNGSAEIFADENNDD